MGEQPKREFKTSAVVRTQNSAWRRETLEGIIYTKSLGWKKAAIRKGIPYKITNSEILELYHFQAGRCAISRVTFPITNNIVRESTIDPLSEASTMTLIRKDPTSPYEVGNVMLVTSQLAQAIGLWGVESLIDMAVNVVKHQLTNGQIRGLLDG